MIPLKSPKLVSHHTLLGTMQIKQKKGVPLTYMGNISVDKKR